MKLSWLYSSSWWDICLIEFPVTADKWQDGQTAFLLLRWTHWAEKWICCQRVGLVVIFSEALHCVGIMVERLLNENSRRSLMEMIFMLMSGQWFSSLPPARDVLTKAKDCRLLLLLGHLSSSAVSSPSLWNVDSRIIDCLHARSRLGEIVWQIQIQFRAVSQWFISDLHNSSLISPCSWLSTPSSMHASSNIYLWAHFLPALHASYIICLSSFSAAWSRAFSRAPHNWTYWNECSHIKTKSLSESPRFWIFSNSILMVHKARINYNSQVSWILLLLLLGTSIWTWLQYYLAI